MPQAPEPLSDAEVSALKARYRAWSRRAGAAIMLAGLLAAFLLGSAQLTLVKGPRPVFLWGPVALELILASLFAGRRRWGLALLCLASVALHARVVTQAAAVAAARTTP